MNTTIDFHSFDNTLRDCGSTWNAAQVHGLVCGCLAAGVAGDGWLEQVLAGVAGLRRAECEAQLLQLEQGSRRDLAARRSEFALLLPADDEPADLRAEALAQWCEGFLHGLVSGRGNAALRARLAEQPLADLIRDLLQITRASADADEVDETTESAYAELVEYVRVAAQLAYEELAPLRGLSDVTNDAATSGQG